MSELPEGWAWATIQETTSPFSTVDPRRSPTETFRYVDIGSIDKSKQTITEPKTFLGRDAPSRARRVIRSKDVLFSTVRTYLKNIAQVPEELDGCLTSTGIAVLRAADEMDPRYLFHWVCSDAFVNAMSLEQDGSLYPAVTDDDVGAGRIPVPPVPEQRRIVAKLDALLAGVARARKELDRVPILIAHHKQALLAAAFSGELTRDWRTKNVTASSDAFVAERQKQIHAIASEPGRGRDEKSALLCTDADLLSHLETIATEQPIPKQWTWAGIGQVFGTYVGATPSRKEPRYWDGTINWVSSGEVAFCRISNTAERITDQGLNNASTRIHPPGTVLLGMIGEGKTRGQAAILDIPACNNQNCAAIRVSESGYPPEYVYWYLHLAYQTTRNAGSGNNQPALNKDRVQRLPIPLAPVEEAFEIARIIAAAFSWLDTVTDEHAHAAKLLPKLEQALLAKAFRGELVPQDPADEPASVLLERIRAEREGCIKVGRVAN